MLLRRARAGEEEALSELAMRSKAHWGYDAAFLEACRADLRVTRAAILEQTVTVAVDEDGEPLGFALVELERAEPELVSLFVEPRAIGGGVGSTLLRAALRDAAAAGVKALLIESDPNAEAFYRAHGARAVGERRSPASGRPLVLLSIPTGAEATSSGGADAASAPAGRGGPAAGRARA